MNEGTLSTPVLAGELRATAPRVRITAGVGSVGQKTWNLRRPVTLIGSRRPAHIVLHDRAISGAHCVIVNTGTDVLLKDLHTRAGTLCNNARIELTLLSDGDVITVGENRIQVAIQAPENTSDDSACGVVLVDPTSFPAPVTVGLVHTDKSWEVKEAVVLIGRNEAAWIRLDHEEVSTRHAVLFRLNDRPAVFDLGGQGGLWVNGRQCPFVLLRDGDCIGVGPLRLRVGLPDGTGHDAKSPAAEAPPGPAAARDAAIHRTDQSAPPTGPPPAPALKPGDGADTGLRETESELEGLRKNITDSWERLNSWKSRLLEDATVLSAQETDLAARGVELDARDAAIRGQLHDVSRYHEQLINRERELAALYAQLRAERDELAMDRAAYAKREAEIQRRTEELSRREHVLAQRWSRLLTATCPHCGRPAGATGESGATSTPS